MCTILYGRLSAQPPDVLFWVLVFGVDDERQEAVQQEERGVLYDCRLLKICTAPGIWAVIHPQRKLYLSLKNFPIFFASVIGL
mmetsp:Transcript_26169/g.38746  ORF Transcript_26169/g.38746 Transcript_26169/m.38746 type:complete len:83 (+) Transcript_26169:3097-3345(+)